jgi:hypothetical protein
MAATATVLGRSSDAERYTAAQGIAAAFTQTFLDEKTASYGSQLSDDYRQTSNVLAPRIRARAAGPGGRHGQRAGPRHR